MEKTHVSVGEKTQVSIGKKNGALWKKEVRIEKEFVIYGKNK